MATGTALLENTLEKVARIIARRRGVKVTLRGGMAYVDLDKMEVVLPQVTDDQYKHMAPYLDGICDHETGHILWTDPKVSKEAAEGKETNGKTRHIFWNLLEDFRTEKLTSEQYIGCAQNLTAMNRHFTGWWVKENWDKADMLGRLIFALGCKLRGDKVEVDFDSDPSMGKLLTAMAPEIADARAGMADTKAALDLADRMLAKIKKLAESEPPPPPKPKSKPQKGKKGKSDAGNETGDDSSPGEGDKESGEGDGDEEQDRDADDDSGSDEGDDGDAGDDESGDGEGGEGGEEESEGEGAGEGDKEGDKEGEGDEGNVDGSDEDSTNGRDGDAADDVGARKQAKDFEDGKESFEKPADLEDFVNKHITEFTDKETSGDPDKYVVFSEEFDTETRYSVDDRVRNAKVYSQIRDQVREYIGTMAAALEAALATEAESRWVGGEKRGRKLDRRRLAEWVMGSENDSIWKRLEEGESIDTAVTLLWDCSGSMGSSEIASNKSALARIAAIAFHEALTRAGIPHEVLGFNSGGKAPEGLTKAVRAAEARGEDMKRYSRLGDTDKRMVFTDFGQADGRAICNITGGAANRDGECVMWAARRLAQRPERRKILIVGSDGQPSGALYGETEKRFLKETVQRVMDAGIEVVGIGIMDKAVRDYYPVNVVIKTVGDLPKVVMGQLTNLLLKKGTGHGQGRQTL